MGLTLIQRLGAIAITSSIAWLPGINAIAIPLTASLQYFTLPQRSLWLQVNGFSRRSRATPIRLWATYYHIHRAQPTPTGQPLLDRSGQPLGITLSHRDWCHAALQGTVQIVQNGRSRLYGFAGRGDTPQTDCSGYFKSLSDDVIAQVNRVRFAPNSTPFGYGTRRHRLVPYRSIAVDRTLIPIGSVVFIPAARGRLITLPSGDRVYHDGFFYAADVGSGIQGNHIDVFLGTHTENPFPFVTSNPSGEFAAYVIQDPDIAQALARLHQ